jgi:hypothetical protein
MTKRFICWALLLLAAVLLAGCGGGALAPAEVAPVPAEVQLLVGERALELEFAAFRVINGDFTGTEGTLTEQVAADCATESWLPYWMAATGGASLTATVHGVTATVTLAPLANDPRYQYTVALALNGLDELSGQAYLNVTVLTGRLGVDLAHPHQVALALTPAAAPEAAITVAHDLDLHTRTIAVQTSRLRTSLVNTLTPLGAVQIAECAVYARAAGAERLRRTMRFSAANEATPDLAPGIRLACWVYDSAIGDPAAETLCYRLLLREDRTGLQRRYIPLSGTWREEAVALG